MQNKFILKFLVLQQRKICLSKAARFNLEEEFFY